jgi:hypothetical protein
MNFTSQNLNKYLIFISYKAFTSVNARACISDALIISHILLISQQCEYKYVIMNTECCGKMLFNTENSRSQLKISLRIICSVIYMTEKTLYFQVAICKALGCN